jgi:hypothetical protein
MTEAKTTILGEEFETTSTDHQSDVDHLAELVGEGKKYASVEELAKSAAHAQRHIETLEIENQGYEIELEKARTAATTTEEILAALKTQAPATTTEQDPVGGEGLTAETVAQLVEQKLAAKETEASEAVRLAAVKQNQTKSWELLDGHFGNRDEATKAMKAYIGDDSGRREVVNQLGGKDPAALLSVLKEFKPETTMPAVSGDTEVNLGFDSGGKQLTWTDAKKLKKDNLKLYNSPQFQAQLLASAKDPNFFNT